MKSSVYFMDLRTNPKENLLDKLNHLLNQTKIKKIIKKKEMVAVKLHFGELGNTAFIRPLFLRRIVKNIKENGGIPFLTDANTLYSGSRSDAPTHLKTAIQNGFSYSVVDAPLIIADGLMGKSEIEVTVKGKRFKKVYIAAEIVNADSIVSVAHFKGHELSGFGGAIKNIGMGCASRRGKMAQHSTLSPKISKKKCTGCGDCVPHCSQSAISVIDKKAQLDEKKCIGCGECILICQNSSINIVWNQSINVFLENMVEYTKGVLKTKQEKSIFINFLTNISPACDCYSHNDAPITRDIGILASKDPVAIDQACADLVNNEQGLEGTILSKNKCMGEDKFKGLYPNVDWEHQLIYAEQIGLGTRKYQLIQLKKN